MSDELLKNIDSDESQLRIHQMALDMAERQAAQALVSAIGWKPPPNPVTLFEQLAEGTPAVDWVVEKLFPAGVGQVNAQRKTGKTTLMVNIAAALAEGTPLLKKFDVNVGPDESIAYLNMELGRDMFNAWCDDLDMTPEAQRRILPYHALDHGFGPLDFSNDRAVDWMIRWLRDSGATILVIDPLGKLYNPARWGGVSDPNAGYNAWWKVLEDIKREVKLRLVLIAHHTGFSEDGADRARGASAMMDNPTVNLAYRHSGDYNALIPPDSKRYLSGFGRGGAIDEFEIEYLPLTRRLYATGGGNRIDSAIEKLAHKLWSGVMSLCTGSEKPNKSELFGSLHWPNSGNSAEKYNKAYRYAVDRKWVEVTDGPRNSKLHAPGPCRPDDSHFGLKLNDFEEPEGDE